MAADLLPLAARFAIREDLIVGLERPLVLAAFPLAVLALWWLGYRRASGTASARSRWRFVAARVVLAALLVASAAGPFTVVTQETPGDPRVSLLVDHSDSTAVSPDVADDLAEGIEAEGVPVTVATIGQETDSRIGDGVAANLREGGAVVVVSDGQVTGGTSLAETAELVRSLNATVSSVSPSPERSERYVTLSGPAKTSAGVESRFLARVHGVGSTEPVTVTVRIDGEEVASETVSGGNGSVEAVHSFDATGPHRITASIDGEDVYDANDVARKTVRVVEQPRVLYVSRGEYPLADYLEGLYDVERAESIPDDLDPYYAVVVQNTRAEDLENVDELQRFVIDGNGAVVVGGPNAYENGGYRDSSIATMLPVTFGESGPGSARIVLLVDVSGSAGEGMSVQKATALDALEQLDDDNEVGIVAFNWRAYGVADLDRLETNRGTLEDRIRRLRPGGATDIGVGLQGAAEMLGDEGGTIILISDGHDDESRVAASADAVGREGIQVISVGAGPSINERVLRRVASETGGQYMRASETDRLRLLFGGGTRQFEGEGLTIVDPDHFVTSGVTLESNPGSVNDVSTRPGADFLVADPDGTPAVASWRYGLGRVVSVTTFDDGGGLDGLLREPDSLVVSKSVNYAIGDPERKASGFAEAGDTRVGEPTTVTFRGDSRPTETNLSFRAVDEGVYRAEVTPESVGFHTAAGATYAANYPAEYAGFGASPALSSAVRSTGGRQFDANDAAEIATFARQQSTQVRSVRQSWDWALLAAALLLFVVEVALRRLQVYHGRTRSESGLP